jgi:NADH dehydrogenase
MKSNFAQLLSWILFGAVLGALLQLFSQLAAIWFGLELVPAATTPTNVKRIVILGGGFAGMKTAGSLEEQFDGDNGVSISLVSETNALLFTPMLRDTS